jgi:O-acetyl-ADP-ribose deacetylase (regulator of RNase III)
MENALSEMESMCRCHGINKVAMPIIGCGLDRLQWDKVSEIIKDVFKDTDIEILVCRQ